MMRKLTALIFACLPLFCLAAERWLPVRDVSLVVEPGSILDLSGQIASEQTLTRRVVVTKEGRLGLQGLPGSQRFHIASLGFGTATGSFPDRAMADLYARQVRIQGYNMVRLDFVEATLMNGRQADFDFDPVQRDRFYYLLAALKREGIYYLLNVLSSDNAAYGNVRERWLDRHRMKVRVFYDEQAREHWQRLVANLLEASNPHTGIPVLADPALAGLILVNEGGLPFVTRAGVPDELKPRFAEWLRKKYGNTLSLEKAWKGELASGESVESATVAFPKPDAWTSRRMADTQRFFVDLEKETLAWMTDYLRRVGYPGLLTAYNNWLSPAAHLVRGQCDWVDMHNYFSEPTRFTASGSVMPQSSLFDEGARYLRELAGSRHIGKAFTVTEYGQVFWNRYRRETALAVPAYASFQNWDAISQHAGAIALSYAETGGRKEAIYPFMVGLDPVARANETLATLLFLRGDVAPSKRMLGIRFDERFVFDESAFLGNLPADLSRLSLVTGIGLDPEGRAAGRYDAQIVPGNGDWLEKDLALAHPPEEKTLAGNLDSLAKRYAGKFGPKFSKTRLVVEDRWERRIAALRAKGFLSPGNATRAETGVFQSDTGEITLDSPRRRLTVVTPRTEAIVFDTPEPVTLRALSVEAADTGALVSVSAMDGRPLPESRRMLVILATDARNSGMRFSDTAETTLQTLGTKPVLIKAATISLKLRHRNAGNLKVFSNTLRGRRGDVIPVAYEQDGLRFRLDTASLSHGPTSYFEIVAED